MTGVNQNNAERYGEFEAVFDKKKSWTNDIYLPGREQINSL